MAAAPSAPPMEPAPLAVPLRPPCPLVTGRATDGVRRQLRLERLAYDVEVHMSTAFVTVAGAFVHSAHGETVQGVLEVPMNQHCTATACELTVGARRFATAIVPRDEIPRRLETAGNYERYNPDAFVLPFGEIAPGDTVTFTFTYFQFLQFELGSYVLRLATTVPPESMPIKADLKDIVRLHVVINSGTTFASWGSASHRLVVVAQEQTRIELEYDHEINWVNKDFDLSYKLWHNEILCTVLNQPPSPPDYGTNYAEEQRGNFSVFITPPEINATTTFGRKVVFVMDKSGSMTGDPIIGARNALSYGINSLNANDMFTVICFSEHQYYFAQELVQATEEQRVAAVQWVQQIQAGGLTDILTPLRAAVNIITQPPAVPDERVLVPFVFLITDGAVDNEQDICLFVRNLKSPVRVNTFGIGSYCNHIFLKMLAYSGKGYMEVAYKSDDVFDQMVRLINMSSAPVLTDVRVGISRLARNVELYPYPIPDLFAGAPLVLSGTYAGDFPATLTVVGKLPTGELWEREVPVAPAGSIPLNKIFVRQRLDILTAQAWLTNSSRIKEQAVELSIKESMPCAHTVMVAYEAKPGQSVDLARVRRRRYQFLTNVAASVIVIGVTGIVFGSIAATMGNFGGFVDVGNIGDVGGENCCAGGCGGGGGGGA
eukprot:Unigene4553_Nuclearia_a/m.13904 Unigene4553_Nuclearia_a/g.13904  ORF Unigene4553_Nuclearia_a/g.13904 Unigene4553_Nuclearia_a/m.13904 type:complete len:658 (+) Unigene4553_Nuclearia_a:34-2007(+)